MSSEDLQRIAEAAAGARAAETTPVSPRRPRPGAGAPLNQYEVTFLGKRRQHVVVPLVRPGGQRIELTFRANNTDPRSPSCATKVLLLTQSQAQDLLTSHGGDFSVSPDPTPRPAPPAKKKAAQAPKE